ncbi:hypothetical protein R1sor_020249 [Riccia sorocarpa]|uniref:Uncharacterized protein n=1 Tax=Riccia sorocarpa TaxID=122646 RepID=A0ABD3IF00_9MARC
MGRAKVLTKKLPIVSSKEVLESAVLNPVPVQRKRGRPRKVITTEELPVEEKKKNINKAAAAEDETTVSQLTSESVDAGKKRSKRPKKLGESADSTKGLPDTNGGGLKFSDEPAKPQIVKREGSRRKSEPRRAAGAGLNTLLWPASDVQGYYYYYCSRDACDLVAGGDY